MIQLLFFSLSNSVIFNKHIEYIVNNLPKTCDNYPGNIYLFIIQDLTENLLKNIFLNPENTNYILLHLFCFLKNKNYYQLVSGIYIYVYENINESFNIFYSNLLSSEKYFISEKFPELIINNQAKNASTSRIETKEIIELYEKESEESKTDSESNNEDLIINERNFQVKLDFEENDYLNLEKYNSNIIKNVNYINKSTYIDMNNNKPQNIDNMVDSITTQSQISPKNKIKIEERPPLYFKSNTPKKEGVSIFDPPKLQNNDDNLIFNISNFHNLLEESVKEYENEMNMKRNSPIENQNPSLEINENKININLIREKIVNENIEIKLHGIKELLLFLVDTADINEYEAEIQEIVLYIYEILKNTDSEKVN